MKILRAALVIFVGFIVYVSAVATVDSLPELYRSIAKNSESNQSTIEYLEKLSENPAIEQGLSCMLAAFAAIAVEAFSRKRDQEPAVMEEQLEPRDSPSHLRRQASESEYLKRVGSNYDELKDKHEDLKEAYKSNAHQLFKTQGFARRQFRLALLLSTALFFALGSLVAAGFQAFVRSLVDPDQLAEPMRFVAIFPQSLALLVCAFAVPF